MASERTKSKKLIKHIDEFDRKKFKEGKLDFIGIQSKVDTNRKLSKKEQELQDRREKREKELASKINRKISSEKNQLRIAKKKNELLA